MVAYYENQSKGFGERREDVRRRAVGTMTGTQKVQPDAGLFHAGLIGLQALDNSEILPIVKTLLSPTDREKCFIAAYYRTVANVRSFLVLNDPSHFQAIAMLARGMFELTVDVRLIDHVADAIPKIYTFSDYERLRAARKIVSLNKAGKTDQDVTIEEAYIASKGPAIDAQCQHYWPPKKPGQASKVAHWSGMNLFDRTKKLGSPFEEMYELNYAQLSWQVHPGLAGVLNFDASAFPAMCGLALKFTFDCYAEMLRVLAQELKIDKVVAKMKEKIKLAQMLPFTDNDAQAEQLRRYLLD